MESPFASANSGFTLYLEPVLNTYYKTYQNIITVNIIPNGPLESMVSAISTSKLSPFQQPGSFSLPIIGRGHNCTFVLLRYPKAQCGGGRPSFKNKDYFMGADDIQSVISYLQNNGYTIDTDITRMLHKSRIIVGGVSETRLSGDRRMICMARYTP
jgi:hypothetical protein